MSKDRDRTNIVMTCSTIIHTSFFLRISSFSKRNFSASAFRRAVTSSNARRPSSARGIGGMGGTMFHVNDTHTIHNKYTSSMTYEILTTIHMGSTVPSLLSYQQAMNTMTQPYTATAMCYHIMDHNQCQPYGLPCQLTSHILS